MALAHLKTGFEQLFDGADDLLFQMAERVGNNRDQAHYFEAMRVLRLGRRKVEKTYLDAVVAGFSAAPAKSAAREKLESDMPELCLKDMEALERTLAVESLIGKAQDHCVHQIWELDSRLEMLTHYGAVPLQPQCFSPRSICEAFALAVASLDAGMTITLIVYQLFERRVGAQLHELYTQLLNILDENGITAAATRATRSSEASLVTARAAPPPPVPPATAHPPIQNAPFAPVQAPIQPPPFATAHVSVQNSFQGAHSAFHQPAYSGPTAGSTPQQLAAAGFNSAAGFDATGSGAAAPGWALGRAKSYTERANTVGQMFNTILAEPTLPDQLVNRFDELRPGVMKTALRDASFFANPAHPARTMVNELASLASNARAMSLDSLQRIEDVVDQLRSEFDAATEAARDSATDPSAPVDLTAFLDDQLTQNRARRRNLVIKVRRVVREELLLRTAGRALPAGVTKLLHSGWAPTLARGVLQEGVNGQYWRRGMDRLDEILSLLDAGPAVQAGAAMRLMSKLQEDFNEAGFTKARSQELLEGFRVALESNAAQATTATTCDGAPEQRREVVEPLAGLVKGPADTQALLRMLLVPGAWFRVQHPQLYGRRWLKAAPFNHDDASVSFVEIDGSHCISFDPDVFLEQVLHGDVLPLEVSALTRYAMDRYVASQLLIQSPRSAITDMPELVS